MIQFNVTDLILGANSPNAINGSDAQSSSGASGTLSAAGANILANGEILDKVRESIADEIPRFDTSAITVSQISESSFSIVVSDGAVHRDSLYSNSKVSDKTGKYVAGLTDIIALKHFGTGYETEVAIGKRRGYWESQGVWIKPISTVGSNFLYGIVHDVIQIIESAGADAYVTIGEDYDI